MTRWLYGSLSPKVCEGDGRPILPVGRGAGLVAVQFAELADLFHDVAALLIKPDVRASARERSLFAF